MNPIRRLGAFPLAISTIAALAGGPRLAAAADPAASNPALPASPADRLAATLAPPLAALVTEALERNPDVARLAAAAEAAAARAPQVRALPDPMASVTAYLLTPETRVGPQQAGLTLSQRFPWFGKLALRERQALYQAAAARAELEARRLALVTEVRRLGYELAFLAEEQRVVETDRATLAHYEDLARARYASGVGREQAAVKLQAEISKDDDRLLEIAQRRASLVAALDALRDRRADAPIPALDLPEAPPLPALSPARLSEAALGNRPELARARALIAAAQVGAELAKKEYRPDLTLGLGYTAVGRREDAAGRAMPPPGNGDDIVGVTLGINLPVWRGKLAAGVDEATAHESAAQEELRSIAAGIDQALDDLTARLPLTRDQLRLFDGQLSAQAAEALRSAESAYGAGSAGALDLLDAERVLLDVRIGAARMRADYLITLSRLEGALGAPLANPLPGDAP
ncbi:MAG: TolC family protein [Acidobacteriota bacterium]